MAGRDGVSPFADTDGDGGGASTADASTTTITSCLLVSSVQYARWAALRAVAEVATSVKAEEVKREGAQAGACGDERRPLGPWMFLEKGWRDRLCRWVRLVW